MIENLKDAIPVDVPNAQDPDGRDLGAAERGIKNSRSGRGIKQLATENRDLNKFQKAMDEQKHVNFSLRKSKKSRTRLIQILNQVT